MEYHIVYKTTFLPTNQYYIGIHSTNNIEDGYLGSGVNILKLLKENSKENFCREILYVFNSRINASNKEKELVTKEVLKDKLCLNKCLGGGSELNFYWTDSLLKKEVGKFKSVKQWRESSPSSYNVAVKRGVHKLLSKNLKRDWKNWTKQDIEQEAKKFKSVSEWRKNSMKSYLQAHKFNIYFTLLEKYNISGGRKEITDEEVVLEAKKYKNTKEYKQNSPYYNISKNRKIYKQCVRHMVKKTSTRNIKILNTETDEIFYTKIDAQKDSGLGRKAFNNRLKLNNFKYKQL